MKSLILKIKYFKKKIKKLETEFDTLAAEGASLKILEKKKDQIDKLKKKELDRVGVAESLSILMGEIGKKIKDQLTTANLIQGAFTLLVAAAIKVDKSTGELAKNIGISYDESLALQKNFNQIAIDSDNIMVSTSALNQSFASFK